MLPKQDVASEAVSPCAWVPLPVKWVTDSYPTGTGQGGEATLRSRARPRPANGRGSREQMWTARRLGQNGIHRPPRE